LTLINSSVGVIVFNLGGIMFIASFTHTYEFGNVQVRNMNQNRFQSIVPSRNRIIYPESELEDAIANAKPKGES
jgi:hypothetical protein